MIRSASLVLGLFLALAASTASAQQLELPRQSPLARAGISIGLTDVSIEYSSPAVKARKIWGGLVPYGKPWRTGANNATKITFSKDVTVGDKAVPAGTYGLYTIPTATSWTVVLSKAYTGNGQTWKPEDDLVRVEVKPKPAPMRERLTFLFSDYTDDVANLDLEWEKLRVTLPIMAKTWEQVTTNIKNMTDNAWRPYANAARYLLDAKKEPERAMELIDESIAVKEDWYNVWIKAQLLAQKGKYKEAYPLAEKAQALGEKGPPEAFFYSADVKKALADWKGK